MKRFITIVLCLCALTTSYADEENSIIVCDNGLEMFAWDLEFIRHAEHSIDVSACFFGGKIAQDLLTAIEERLVACPELRAHILATPILMEQKDIDFVAHLESTYPGRFRLIHATNVAVMFPEVTGIDNHVKMCVVDEQYYSMGGTNLEDAQCSEGTFTPPHDARGKLNPVAAKLPSGMRDQDIVGRGSLATDLRRHFYKIFALWEHYNKHHSLIKDFDAFTDNAYDFEVPTKPFIAEFEASDQLIPLEGGQMRLLCSGAHQKENVITKEYIRLINGAKREIKIANLYFTPEGELQQAFLDAVNRGVKLTIITNGISPITPEYNNYFGWANRISYVPVLYGQKRFNFWDYWTVKNSEIKDTTIYEYHVEDILLHKKIMIVDNTTFLLGSYNLGVKSDKGDYEIVAVIESEEAVRAINAVYKRDLQFSRKVTKQEAIKWYFDPTTLYLGELQKRFHGLI